MGHTGVKNENFRMSRENFYKLLNELHPFITRQITNIRMPVAVVLYEYVDGGCMRKTANNFGLAYCTILQILQRVTKAIATNLAPKN